MSEEEWISISSPSPSSSDNEEEEEDITPVFPFCEGMDMSSDGSDFDDDDAADDDDGDFDAKSDVLEYDDTSKDKDPKVLQLFHQAADDTDQWDEFVRHLLDDHPFAIATSLPGPVRDQPAAVLRGGQSAGLGGTICGHIYQK
mmetsp:Transcript_9951/g.27855  ORF Transcript_9951/g.27855 Transcript_9951/m.27855 type:complete len:143 (-) Transcript_9951:131-559(-)